MYIRAVKKQRSKDSKVFYQYSLAQTYRADGKVKQRAILYLGSSELLFDKANRAIVLAILKSKIFGSQELFPINAPKPLYDLGLALYEKYCLKYGDAPTRDQVSIPPAPAKAEFHNIDIKGLEVEQVKTYGAEHLCKQTLDKLQLRDCFKTLSMSENQIQKSLLAIASRAIFSASEHKTAQYLQTNSSLSSCFDIDKTITHKQLYRVSDRLYKHKEVIDEFLYKRISTMFDLEDKLVIFDISNTYFETRKASSKIAKYGRSKEKRNDCPLVVFTGVINPEGFIRHSRVYEGNTPDASTLEDMSAALVNYSPSKVKQTIVIDAGIATEENLECITAKGYRYVCVARKKLKDYPLEVKKRTITQTTDRGKHTVELAIFNPTDHQDTWMYVESEAKRKKEVSINEKLTQRFEEELSIIQKAMTTKGGIKRIDKVWERIGRVKQKNNRVAAHYHIEVEEKDGIATAMTWTMKPNKSKEDKTKGVYFIRTNYENPNEQELWNIYNTIREVEATFRCLKTDLNIRPVYHQKDQRIEAHIYLTILAYQLVNTIRHMLKSQGIDHDWSNIVRIMNTQTIQTIHLPTDKKNIQLTIPSNPINNSPLSFCLTI